MTELSLNRGDVVWVDLDPTVGSEIKKLRPCVIVSDTIFNQIRRTVVVVPLSSAGRPHPPIVVPVVCLNKNALAVCDQVRAVSKIRIKNHAGSLTVVEMRAIEEGIRTLLRI